MLRCNFLLTVVFIGLLAVSCTATNTTDAITETGTRLASSTSDPTASSANITSEPTITEQTPQYCVGDGIPALPDEDFGIPGSLVYYDVEQSANVIIGGTPLKRSILPIPTHVDIQLIGFSPDGELLAYTDGAVDEGRENIVHIISYTNDEFQITPDQSQILHPVREGSYIGAWGWSRWVNDSELLAYLSNPSENHHNRYFITLLDIYSGDWQSQRINELPSRKTSSGIYFSPDMSRALYSSEIFEPDYRIDLILWDTINQKTVWDQKDFDGVSIVYGGEGWNSPAAWSHDSMFVAYTGVESPSANLRSIAQQGVFLLDKEGSVASPITDFLSKDYNGFTSHALSWAPNNQYLAFLVDLAENSDISSNAYIYLYDLSQNELIKICPMIGDYLSSTSASLVWSPDSRFLAYAPSYYDDIDRQDRPLIVIDVYSGSVTQVANTAVNLGGWSDKFIPSDSE